MKPMVFFVLAIAALGSMNAGAINFADAPEAQLGSGGGSNRSAGPDDGTDQYADSHLPGQASPDPDAPDNGSDETPDVRVGGEPTSGG
jgi:hypothetical protein